jgi:curli biogenesis system outer membrane secretion channel CsgG
LRYPNFLFSALLICSLLNPLQAQTRRRIAVLAADRASFRGYMNQADQQRLSLEAKLVDALVSKLASNPSFEVLDRSETQTLEGEQDNKLNDRFDPAQAAKLGKLQGVNVMIFVGVGGFQANASEEHKDLVLYTKTTVQGVVHLSVNTKAIAVDTGAVLSAPSAEKNETFIHESKSAATRTYGAAIPPRDVTQANSAALSQLVDKAVDESTAEISSKLAGSLTASVSIPRPVGTPKVVGIDQGKVMVNRGSTGGLKVGDRFQVIRMADSGFKDPDSGQPIIRKKRICSLILSDVDESLAYGSCEGEVPQAGDQLVDEVAK